MNGPFLKMSFAVGALVVVAACIDSGDSVRPKVVQLSPDEVRHVEISYSPDGRHIAWWSPATDSTGNWQLWVANADMSAPATLPVATNFTGALVWSPDGARIAATSSEFGLADVVVVPAAGGAAQRVTRGAGIELPVAWFPDGDRLAYVASAEGGTFSSFVVSLKTGLSVPLVPGEKRPAFGVPSPDGSHVAYSVGDGAKSTIWLADGGGGNPRQLTTEGFEGLVQAPWSPDGKELLYQSRRTGTADLWVLPIDGGTPRQLTRDVRNDYLGSWSPDGKWVAFISDRGRQTDVWVVPAAGGEEQRVTETALEEQRNPRWRPGTNELTFATNTQTSGVWAMDLASGKELRLTPDSIRPNARGVSPDGKQVLLELERGGGIQDIAVVPVAGGAWRSLVAGGGAAYNVSWSPDGSKVVFTSDRGGTDDIWVVDAAGGAPRQLVNWPGYEGSPAWSGDGSAIYFTSDRDARLSDLWKVPVSGGEPVRVTRDGSIGRVQTRAGVADAFVEVISARGGQLAISRVLKDGRLQPVWDKTNSGVSAISPAGDSIVASVEQADGKQVAMILPAGGGAGRKVLKANEGVLAWSNDGKWMLYLTTVAGETDLGLLNVADGTTRRLTTTPESEYDASFTPDGKTVAFRRRTRQQDIWTTDLTKLLTGGK